MPTIIWKFHNFHEGESSATMKNGFVDQTMHYNPIKEGFHGNFVTNALITHEDGFLDRGKL